MDTILIRILDGNYQTKGIIDVFSEFAWAVKRNEFGDFEFTIPLTSKEAPLLTLDSYVYIRESDRLMIIEKVATFASLDEPKITVSGRSLESILDRRIIWEKTTITGNFQESIKRIVNSAFVSPLVPERRIANFSFRDSTDPTIANLTVAAAEYYGENVYDVVSSLCKDKKIGFRILPNWSNGGFIFELYAGVNRSYTQTTIPWVVFSPKMENLLEARFVEKREDLKTAALVLTTDKNRSMNVVSDKLPFTSLQRREICVESDVQINQIDKASFGTAESRLNIENYGAYTWEITPEDYAQYQADLVAGKSVKKEDYGTVTWYVDPEKTAQYQADLYAAQMAIDNEYLAAISAEFNRVEKALTTAGQTELSTYDVVKIFDGDVANTRQFVYGKDFFLGDTVQLVDEAGHEGVCVVSEVLIIQDSEGISVSPTFESM